MYKKIALLLLLILCLITTTGCWDSVEIERNAFVLGLGIDSEEDGRLTLTFQLALLKAFKGEKGEDGKSTHQMTITSDTIADATRELLSYYGEVPNFTHCKLVVFGEDYAKKGIRDSLDFLFREPELRRVTSVCVSKGRAKDILELEPKMGPSSAMVIDQILTQNSVSNSEIFPFKDIRYLYQNFTRNSDLGLPKVDINQGTARVSGAGVFKDSKLIGWYEGHEVTGLRLILGSINQSFHSHSLELPWEEGGKITFNTYNIHSSTVPKLTDGKITLKIDVMIEGDVNEVRNPSPLKNREKLLKEWGRALENDISSNINSVYRKGRDVYGVDTFEIDHRMESHYPEFWNKNKDQWNEIFKTVDLELKVDVKIRRVGIIEP